MTNNYPRPQLRPGQLRIKDEDICQVVPGEGSFDNPTGSGGQHELYHKNHALQNHHISLRNKGGHSSKKANKRIQKIIDSYTAKVDRASATMYKKNGLGHIKPDG
jgi:hypothetical protein